MAIGPRSRSGPSCSREGKITWRIRSCRGYVRRGRTEEDRREVLLALTPKGENVLAELALHHHQELKEAAPRLVESLRRVMAGKEDGADKPARRTTTGAKAPSSHVSSRP